METEKNILKEVLCTDVSNQGKTEGEKKNSIDAFINKELDLERWVGESEKDYHERLLAIHATQVSLISNYLISNYDEEKELNKYRMTDEIFANLLERGDEEDIANVIRAISTLQQEVVSYVKDYPQFYEKPKVKEKLMDLESLT